MTLERRGHERRPLKRVGTIACSRPTRTLNCIVRNVSDAGALIEVKHTSFIPTTFTLTAAGVCVDRPCFVVRRTAHMLGVSFSEGRSATMGAREPEQVRPLMA